MWRLNLAARPAQNFANAACSAAFAVVSSGTYGNLESPTGTPARFMKCLLPFVPAGEGVCHASMSSMPIDCVARESRERCVCGAHSTPAGSGAGGAGCGYEQSGGWQPPAAL